MSLKKTEAIILRHRHFGNTSLIFTFYTKEYGKLEALAKGIKKGISRGGNSMEIFSQAELIYYDKEPRTLRLLSQWYLLNSFKSLRRSPLKFSCASYLIELVDSLVHGEEKNEKLYYLLLNSLELMEKEKNFNRLIHFFEVKLIGLLGYSLGQNIARAMKHQSIGLSSEAIPPQILSQLRFLENADFQTLSRLKISEKDENALRVILQNYLSPLIGNRTLRTLTVIKNLEKDIPD